MIELTTNEQQCMTMAIRMGGPRNILGTAIIASATVLGLTLGETWNCLDYLGS